MDCFRLFDNAKPFLQDASLRDTATVERKSAGSFYAEFASGSNIAHFHHGDDEKMRLCLRCATIGLLRVVPWSQAGGSGITPSVHNAPPIMALALGENLAKTLGLNLVPISAPAGFPQWTGHFRPSEPTAAIPYLEALPGIHGKSRSIRPSRPAHVGCGRPDLTTIGPIVFKKNGNTKKRSDGRLFEWNDPAAFYAADAPHTTLKSHNEQSAADGSDLLRLADTAAGFQATRADRES